MEIFSAPSHYQRKLDWSDVAGYIRELFYHFYHCRCFNKTLTTTTVAKIIQEDLVLYPTEILWRILKLKSLSEGPL